MGKKIWQNWTTEDLELIRRLHEDESWTFTAIQAAHFPTKTDVSVKSAYQRAKKRAREQPTVLSGEKDELILSSDRVITLDELLEHYQVDLDVWEVRDWKASKWEVGAKHPETGEVLIAPLFQVAAWFRRKSGATLTAEKIAAGVLQDIRHEQKRSAPVAAYRQLKNDDTYLFEYAPFDLHMGKYCWAEETVADYDVDKAEDLFKASLDYLLPKALRNADGRIERILFPVGNDASHVDGKDIKRTGGTQMEAFDSRYVRVFRRLCAVHRYAVSVLLDVAPVDILVIPGNHDEETAFHLGDHIEAYFHGHKHVSVNNGARLRKYYSYGVNLLGFTHGVHEKPAELPLMMAREVPELWAKCPLREWHIGHKHKADAMRWRELDSDKGVRVRILSSLSAHDTWHINNGYMDRRACDSFLWHKRAGFTDHMSFNVDHFTGAPHV